MLLFYKLPELERIYRYTCENAQIPYLPRFFYCFAKTKFRVIYSPLYLMGFVNFCNAGNYFFFRFLLTRSLQSLRITTEVSIPPRTILLFQSIQHHTILMIDGDSHVTFKCVHNVNNVNFTWMHIRQIIKNTFSTKTTAPSSSCRMRRWCWSQKLLFLSTQHPPS